MPGRSWIVRDRCLHERNGNGVWSRTPWWVGAQILRWKIATGRYRGTKPWTSWRRHNQYVVPTYDSLVVLRTTRHESPRRSPDGSGH